MTRMPRTQAELDRWCDEEANKCVERARVYEARAADPNEHWLIRWSQGLAAKIARKRAWNWRYRAGRAAMKRTQGGQTP